MTLGVGHRFVIVDGVERWRDDSLAELEAVLGSPPPDTTVAFFAREDSRARAPERLHAAVRAAGGDVAAERAAKPWELPKWVAEQARGLGLELEPGAAKALVARVGERQQRLLRELEKLALGLPAGARVGPDDVDELAAGSAERKAWSLADAVVARDRPAVARLYLELRGQGERLTSLLFQIARRLREAHDASTRLETGEPVAQVKRSLRMPPKAADRFLAAVERSDRDALRAAIGHLADLEIDSRGGHAVPEDTAALRMLMRVTG
jgi:DNA polymerase-3 subunit delta